MKLALAISGLVMMSTACPGLLATANASSIPPTGTRSLPAVIPDQQTPDLHELVQLIETDQFGQNMPAIDAIEAAYVEMWVQDVTAMLGN